MAKHTTSKSSLIIKEQYYNDLDIRSFSQMMKDPSYCYKFYWLEAIVELINKEKTEVTFDEIIDEMICNAWYSVREFHIHLSAMNNDGKIDDALERCVNTLAEVSDLKSNAYKSEILKAIRKHNSELKKHKEQLIKNVPYRALSGFFNSAKVKITNWKNYSYLSDSINMVNSKKISLPYVIAGANKLDTVVYFQDSWIEMIRNNSVSIRGWIQNEKVKWLQKINPEVPNIIFKLQCLDKRNRKLGAVRNLWDAVFYVTDVKEVFAKSNVNKDDYAVDHFIPWSFVMTDELWNLMPMDPSLNIAKSNLLPEWDPYFKKFADNQFLLYKLINKNDRIKELYIKCYDNNLHSIWAVNNLYNIRQKKSDFCEVLEKNMRPVYDSAYRQGYKVWN